jgi:hypothetical protein
MIKSWKYMPVKPLRVGKKIYYYNIPVYHFKEIKVKMKTKNAKVRRCGSARAGRLKDGKGVELTISGFIVRSYFSEACTALGELFEEFFGLQFFPQVVLQKEGEDGLTLFQRLGRE